MGEVYPGGDAPALAMTPLSAFEDLFDELPVDLCIAEVTGVFRVVYANQAAIRDQIVPALAHAGLTGERAHLEAVAIGEHRWDIDVYPWVQPGESPRSAVVRAVQTAGKAAGAAEVVVLPIFAGKSTQGRGPLELSQREREVADLVAQGMTNAEIATRLFLSRATVATHIAGILTKLRFRSRAQIAVWVVEQRLRAAIG